MGDDWTWRDDARSFLRWQPLQTAWDWFWGTALGKAVVAGVITLIGTIASYFGSAPRLTLLFEGALIASIAILLPSAIQYVRRSKPVTPPIPQKVEPEYIEIVNQTIERRDVPLDGYKYFGCTFTDVTFVYNNGDAGGFDHSCRMGGKLGFKSEDPHIQTMLGFLAAIRLLRPDLQEKYTPKLGAPNPLSDATLIATADELGSFWSRLVGNWNDCKQKFANFDGAHEYVQNFWDELNNNKTDPQMRRVERMFPGQTLNIDDIVPMQKQMVADAVEFRNAIVDFVSLLSFSFK